MENINLSNNFLTESNSSKISSAYYGNSSPENKYYKFSSYCRICQEDESVGDLIDPCDCSGSLKFVHTFCLEKWLTISNTDQCEICKYKIPIQKKDKPIHKWWKSSGAYATPDFICLIILTPLCSIASYLCGMGITTYQHYGTWKGLGLAILCFSLITTYFFWLFITIRIHFISWRHWCSNNQDVKLVVKLREQERPSLKILTIKEDITENRFFTCFDYHHNMDDVLYNLEATSYV